MRLASAARPVASTCQPQEFRDGFVIAHVRAFCGDIMRNPIRKRRFVEAMTAVGRVHFVQSRDVRGGEARRHAQQRRPQPPVHEADLSVHDAADQYVRRFAHRTREGENRLRARMRPPVAADRSAGDRGGEGYDIRMLRRFGDDALPLDERERLACVYDLLRRSCCHNTSPWPDARASTREMTNSRSDKRLSWNGRDCG